MPKKPQKNASIRTLHIRVLAGELIAMGPGRADLIDAIARTGSISAAGRELNMSYRRAWSLIETSNAAFVEPLVITNTGGSGGGGAQVTDFGRSVVERYRIMERKAAKAIASDFATFNKLVAATEAAATRSVKKTTKK